jgi:hypothetical protein
VTVLAVQVQARTQISNLHPKGSVLGFQNLNSPKQNRNQILLGQYVVR